MPNVPRSARLEEHSDGSVTLRFPYHPMLVEEIKRHVPARFRRYDAEAVPAWTVYLPYTQIALSLLRSHFGEVTGPRKAQPRDRQMQEPRANSAFAALHLLQSAPRSVVDAAYRALAKQHHPDLGGDPETMRRLTEAYGVLSRRLGA